MSNRKAHRRENSFRRFEKFVQHRLRRPNRSDRVARQFEVRRDRRRAWKLLAQWIGEISEVIA
jgi:hypothetical protein